MSNDYPNSPLLSKDNNEGFSDVIRTNTNPMGALRRTPFHIKVQRFLRTRTPLSIFGISCLLPTIIFCCILIYNIDHVIAFFSNVGLALSSSSNTVTQAIDSTKGPYPQDQGLTFYDKQIRYKDYHFLRPDSLTYENRTYEDNIDVFFRFPKKRDIYGVLLIFHGCSRSAYDWFHTIERQRIIGAAIDLGYACLAFQSFDRTTRCWSTNSDIYDNIDAQRVLKALDYFYKEFPNLASLPRFTFGASSGGMFSSIFVLNQHYKIQGQILLIAIIVPDILEFHVKANNYPPTAWIYMTRDREFASLSRIGASTQTFIREKIPFNMYEIRPISLTPRTLRDRIPSLTLDTTSYIVYRLRQNHLLDAHNHLIHNPRRNNLWQKTLFPTNTDSAVAPAIIENLQNHKNILPDFFNTAYGQHEISFERSFEALTWLQSHANSLNTS